MGSRSNKYTQCEGAHSDKKVGSKCRWWKRILLGLCSLPVIFLIFLCTTGIRLDPLLPLLGSQLEALPCKINKPVLWVKCALGRQAFIARVKGLKAFHEDASPVVELTSLEVTVPFTNLFAKKLLPDLLEINGLKLTVRKTEDGGFELFPFTDEAEKESTPWRTPEMPASLQPLEKLPFKARLTNLQVALREQNRPQQLLVPNASIEASYSAKGETLHFDLGLTHPLQERTTTVAVTGSWNLNNNALHTRTEYARIALEDWTPHLLPALPLAIEGELEGHLELTLNLQTLQPKLVDYSLSLADLKITADDWLIAPLAFAPFTLSGSAAFEDPIHAQFHATPLQAGPFVLEFSPWVAEHNDSVNVLGEVRLHQLAAVDVLALLKPDILANIPADSLDLLQLNGTGPVVDHLGVVWTVAAFFNKDYTVQSIEGAVNLGMSISLNDERIQPELRINYHQTSPSHAKIHAKANLLQPAVPARWSFLVANHKADLDCIQIPLSFSMEASASVNPATTDLPEIESLALNVSSGQGEVHPLPELSKDWTTPLKVNRLNFDLKSTNSLKHTELVHGIIELDEPVLDFSGITITSPTSPLQGLPKEIAITGGLKVTSVPMPWVCSLISEEHRKSLPLSAEEIAAFSLREFLLKMDTKVTLSDEQIVASGSIQTTTIIALGETNWIWNANADVDVADGIKVHVASQPLSLGIINLPLLERFGVQPNSIRGDLIISGDARLDDAGKPLEAKGSLALSNGYVSLPQYLTNPFQWDALSANGTIDLSTGTFPLLEAKLESPLITSSFTMKDTSMSEDFLSTRLSVQGTIHSLPELLAQLAPIVHLGENSHLDDLQPNGKAEATLSLSYKGSINKPAPESIADLEGSVALTDLSMLWAPELLIGCSSIRINLKEDSLQWTLHGSHIGNAVALHSEGSMRELLGENPRLLIKAECSIDLGYVPALAKQFTLQSFPSELLDDPSGNLFLQLDGNAALPTYAEIFALLDRTAHDSNSIDWLAETTQFLSRTVEDFYVTSSLDAKSISLPALGKMVSGVAFTPINATARMDGAPSGITLSATANLDNFQVEGFAQGPIQGSISAKLSKNGMLHTELQTQLDDFNIDLAALGLAKPRGTPSHLRFAATLDDVSPLIPFLATSATSTPDQPSRLDFEVDYLFLLGGDFSGNLIFSPSFTGDFWGVRRLQLNEIDIDHTHFDFEASVAPQRGVDIRIDGTLFDLQELLTVGSPVVYKMMLDSPPQSREKTDTPSALPKELALLNNTVTANINFDQIRFTPLKQLTDFTGAFELQNLKPYQVHLSAMESGRNLFSLRIEPPKTGLHDVCLIIPDCVSLADVVLSPLGQFQLNDAELQSKIDALLAIPASFKGGVLQMQGKSTLGQSAGTLYDGNLRVDDLYLTTTPKLLRILAQRTLKPVTEQKAFNIFNIEKVIIAPDRYSIRNFRIEGPLTLNVKEAVYSIPNKLVTAEGDHALVKFWIKWPTDKPFGIAYVDIENKLIRALGTDISEFGDLGDF